LYGFGKGKDKDRDGCAASILMEMCPRELN
jgi:hypothetical protein